jgi:hypothetical protein
VIKVLSEIYHLRINYIEKTTKSIRNQQYINLEQPKIADEAQKDVRMQIEPERIDNTWEALCQKLDKVSENQKLPNNNAMTREIDSIFTDLDEWNLDFYFLTQDQPNTFGILEDIETYRSDETAKVEWKVDIKQAEKEAKEFSWIRRKLEASIKNIGKSFKKDFRVCKDLDRFISQRIPFYFDEGVSDGLHMIKLNSWDEEVFKPLPKWKLRSSNVKLRFLDFTPEDTFPSQQPVSRRTLKKWNNQFESLGIVLQASSSDRGAVLKANQKIDNKIAEMIR